MELEVGDSTVVCTILVSKYPDVFSKYIVYTFGYVDLIQVRLQIIKWLRVFY